MADSDRILLCRHVSEGGPMAATIIELYRTRDGYEIVEAGMGGQTVYRVKAERQGEGKNG